ncbi:MAG: hypothetical protein K0U86_20895 [Planctomycetes bacterium]|nr:hypothetical protein [Planctomycetota bacterium]
MLSQTQTAAGWGITPQLSYSQHFWNRYQEQATWKNYALPPREKDIEEIQKRKRAYQEQQSSSYLQQPTMVPVQYQNIQQQSRYQQQYQQPAQQQYQQPAQQQYQQPAQQQYQQPAQQQYQQPTQQQYQQPAQQFQKQQPIQPQYPAATPRFNQARGY